ncbi:MAG: hypothetical protein GTO13_01670 [Proteobacteria bacterium]|nr:hypothetical protein [Pseudomonadota bacterium]
MEPLHEGVGQMVGFCAGSIPNNALVRSEFRDYTLFLLQMGRDIRPKENVLRLERRWDS